jgi:hypothetical protein
LPVFLQERLISFQYSFATFTIMDQAYLNLGAEALALCNSIQAKVAELEALEAQILAQDKAEAGPSGTSTPLSRSKSKGVVPAVEPIPVAAAAGLMADSDSSMEEAEDEYEEYNHKVTTHRGRRPAQPCAAHS